MKPAAAIDGAASSSPPLTPGPSPRGRGEVASLSGGEGLGGAEVFDILADRLEAGEDGVGEGAQGVAGIAVLDVGERHVEGDEEGAQMAQIIGDVEQGLPRRIRQIGAGPGAGRAGEERLERCLHPRDLPGRTPGEHGFQPDGVVRRQTGQAARPAVHLAIRHARPPSLARRAMTRPVHEASTPAPRNHSGRDENGRGYTVPGEDMRRAGACAADGREAGARAAGMREACLREACLREAGIPADSGHAEAARIRRVRFHRKPAKVPSRRGAGLISLIVAIGKVSVF